MVQHATRLKIERPKFDIAIWVCKVRVVQDIEGIAPDQQADPFRQPELPCYRQINLREPEPRNVIPAFASLPGNGNTERPHVGGCVVIQCFSTWNAGLCDPHWLSRDAIGPCRHDE